MQLTASVSTKRELEEDLVPEAVQPTPALQLRVPIRAPVAGSHAEPDDERAGPAPMFLAPREWARDLGLVGASSALVSACVMHTGLAYALALVAAASALGALLGASMPLLLHRRVRKMPVVLLLGAGAGLGANWGGLAAALAALVTGAGLESSVLVGGNFGLMQLGWLWLPLVLTRARGRSTRPYLLAAPFVAIAIAALLARTIAPIG